MRIAFYAPLKPPDAPTPSGDRSIARLLMRALAVAGHEVALVSHLRSYAPAGAGFAALDAAARNERDRLAACWRASSPPDLWLTYHLYRKAPDLLGPALCDAFGLPWVVVEPSSAPRHADGPWADGHRAVVRALGRADGAVFPNPRDRDCVLPLLSAGCPTLDMPPFLDLDGHVPAEIGETDRRPPLLLAVGMMRDGDKLESYRRLAAALARIAGRDWRLRIVGDGPARGHVEEAFAQLAGRVDWAGAVAGDAMPAHYATADLLVWPAVNEAIGMAVLEAQAAGLPVVVGRSGALSTFVVDGETGRLVDPCDGAALAGAIAALLDDAPARRAMRRRAAAHVQSRHGLGAAARHLDRFLHDVRERRAP